MTSKFKPAVQVFHGIATPVTVWVATSRYAEDDGCTLVGVGDSANAAEAALEVAIQSHNEDETFDRDMWIDEPAIQVPFFTKA